MYKHQHAGHTMRVVSHTKGVVRDAFCTLLSSLGSTTQFPPCVYQFHCCPIEHILYSTLRLFEINRFSNNKRQELRKRWTNLKLFSLDCLWNLLRFVVFTFSIVPGLGLLHPTVDSGLCVNYCGDVIVTPLPCRPLALSVNLKFISSLWATLEIEIHTTLFQRLFKTSFRFERMNGWEFFTSLPSFIVSIL